MNACLSLQEIITLTFAVVWLGSSLVVVAMPEDNFSRWSPLPTTCCAIPACRLHPSPLASPFLPTFAICHISLPQAQHCLTQFTCMTLTQFVPLLVYTSSPGSCIVLSLPASEAHCPTSQIDTGPTLFPEWFYIALSWFSPLPHSILPYAGKFFIALQVTKGGGSKELCTRDH